MKKNLKLPRIDWGAADSPERVFGGGKRRIFAPVVRVGPLGPDDLRGAIDSLHLHAEDRFRGLGEMFKLSDKVITEGIAAKQPRLFGFDGKQKLEVFRASGSWRWTTLEAEARETAPEGPAIVPDDPIAKADAWLASRGMADPRARPIAVSHTEMTIAEGKKFSTFVTQTHVDYRFWLNGLPVFGAGAKMRVTFGQDGEVGRAYKFWRDPLSGDDLPTEGVYDRVAAAPRRALQPAQDKDVLRKRLRRDPTLAKLKQRTRVRVGDVRLGYYAAPPRETQLHVVPVFACQMSAVTAAVPRHDFVRYVSAVRMRAGEWQLFGSAVQSAVLR